MPLRNNGKFSARYFSEKMADRKDFPSITGDILSKIPPHSVEAEKAVFGGILINKNGLLRRLEDILVPEDFYFPAHKVIYAACLELDRKNIPIDAIALADQLQSNNLLEKAGGAVYIAELLQMVVSGVNAEYYAGIVHNRALLRSLIDAGAVIIDNGFDTVSPVEELINKSEQAIFAVSQKIIGQHFESAGEILKRVFAALEKRSNHKGEITGVTTGFTELDKLTAGLQKTELIIVAARPAMGKTAFALSMAMKAALAGTGVAFFSLEMSSEQLMTRMLCAHSKIDANKVRVGDLYDGDFRKLYASVDILGNLPIFIDDSPGLSSLEVRGRARRIMAEKKIGIVFVDYLQLMRSPFHMDSREQEISEISRSLKTLAKEMNIPVVALAQLNRKVEDRPDKKPILSDLRESGAIEQDADVIMFLYRESVYAKEKKEKKKDSYKKGNATPDESIVDDEEFGKKDETDAEIIIGKQRNGPTGSVHVSFLKEYTAFENRTDTEIPSEDVDIY